MQSLRGRAKIALGSLRALFPSHRYQVLHQKDDSGELPLPLSPRVRLQFQYPPKRAFRYLAIFVLATLVASALVFRGLPHTFRHGEAAIAPPPPAEFPWQAFPLERGYFEGLRKLKMGEVGQFAKAGGSSNIDYPSPVEYKPFRVRLEAPPAEQCFLDERGQIIPPAIWVYQGVTEHAPEPMLGMYETLGLNKDICFDRYGRHAAYGFGYKTAEGGTSLGMLGDMKGTGVPLDPQSRIDWRKVDIGRAQTTCREKNQHRFSKQLPGYSDDVFHHAESWLNQGLPLTTEINTAQSSHLPRTAMVLRLWDTYNWTEYSHIYIRSLINELNLQTGAEYDIHLLVQIKDGSPIFASDRVYNAILEKVVPKEYRPMATLWSADLMRLLYPGPFEPQFQRPGPIYSVGRSMHMALQWFAMRHPEYDFFWNWEMDMRYVGHWYELFDRTGMWADDQPRKGLWERSGRFYIPGAHSDWNSFSEETEQRARNGTNEPVWGPQTFLGWDETDRAAIFGSDYLKDLNISSPPPSSDMSSSTWGIGEPADYITFLPLFNPAQTFWNIRADVSGYNTDLPIPPRRTSIVTGSRFSHRLLTLMHRETALARHSMAGEIFPASVSLHHGLKAVFAPHPMYFNRRWNDSGYIDHIFNGNPTTGESGGYGESVFSEFPQHNFRGGTYYYDAAFAQRLWRQWLGYREEGERGAQKEVGQGGTGRMCLRSMLLHPVKREQGDVG